MPALVRAVSSSLLVTAALSVFTGKRSESCSCSCCETVKLSTALRSTNGGLICSPMSAGCPVECQDVADTYAAKKAATTMMSLDVEVALTDYTRYCSETCVVGTKLGSGCSFPEEAETSNPVNLAKKGKSKAVQEPDTTVQETNELVAEAEGQKSQAIAAEAQAALTEANVSQATVRATMSLNAAKTRLSLVSDLKVQLTEAAARAQVFADAAKTAAERAAQALEEIKEIPAEAAKEAAAAAVQQLKDETKAHHDAAKFFEESLTPPKAHSVPLAPEARAAAEPFEKKIQSASDMAYTYEAKATALKDEAERLRQGAKSLRDEADALDKGHHAQKEQLQAKALELLKHAQDKEGFAMEAHNKAKGIQKKLPKLREEAKMALDKANSLAQARWMPPPAA
jgi:hypothetical protein